MEVSQSVVITVVPLYQAHIVGGITIPQLFAMCGQVVAIRNANAYGGQSTEHATHIR